jgi:hypothetical protein
VGNTYLALGTDAFAARAHVVAVFFRHGLIFINAGDLLNIIPEVNKAAG